MLYFIQACTLIYIRQYWKLPRNITLGGLLFERNRSVVRVHQYCTLDRRCISLMEMASGSHRMRHCRTMALSSRRHGQGWLQIRSSAHLVRLASSCVLFPHFSHTAVHPSANSEILVIPWRHVFADDRPAVIDSDAEEVRRLNVRITSAKLQADALEEMLTQLQTTSSGEGANEAARHRAALAVDYCNARLARLQAAIDSVDGAENSAAAANGASGTRQAEL